MFVSRLTEVISAAAPNPSNTAAGAMGPQPENSLAEPSLILSPNFDQNGGFMGEPSFSDVFDSLNWVFDGIPESFVGPPVI